MTLDTVHVALYAALIGAGAALFSQFVAQGSSALIERASRRRRERRTRAMFRALVHAAMSGFDELRIYMPQTISQAPLTDQATAVRSLLYKLDQVQQIQQPLYDAISDHDALRDLQPDAIFRVTIFTSQWTAGLERLKARAAECGEAITRSENRPSGAAREMRETLIVQLLDRINHAIDLVDAAGTEAQRSLE